MDYIVFSLLLGLSCNHFPIYFLQKLFKNSLPFVLHVKLILFSVYKLWSYCGTSSISSRVQLSQFHAFAYKFVFRHL